MTQDVEERWWEDAREKMWNGQFIMAKLDREKATQTVFENLAQGLEDMLWNVKKGNKTKMFN